MEIRYPEVGVCGLSCRLCPRHHTEGESRCGGCKTESRMAAGCPFITCALRRQGVEFCWDCEQAASCERWAAHRAYGRERDTFVCYAALEENIAAVERDGIEAFVAEQSLREQLLREMLAEFNEGRSKTRFSIAATVLSVDELRSALEAARRETTGGMDLRQRSRLLRAHLDAAAEARSVTLRLRK